MALAGTFRAQLKGQVASRFIVIRRAASAPEISVQGQPRICACLYFFGKASTSFLTFSTRATVSKTNCLDSSGDIHTEVRPPFF